MTRRARAVTAIAGGAIAFGAFGVAMTSDDYGYAGALCLMCAIYIGLATILTVLWFVCEWIEQGGE